MMKPRTQFSIIIALLILLIGIAWFTLPKRDEGPAQILPAAIKRDCAPWDGAAFSVSIPYDATTTIVISIWQSPDIKRPVTFSFPDETMQLGAAYFIAELDPLEALIGQVTFQRVEAGIPVEGGFDLATESGKRYKGKFEAQWGSEIVMCG